MPAAHKPPSRLRVALLESEPIRVQGFLSLFSGHSRIEFAAMDLPRLLADREFALALIGMEAGMHADPAEPELLSTIRAARPNLRLIVMGPDAADESILTAIGAGAKAYLEASASPRQVEQAIEIVSQGSIWAPRRLLSTFVDRVTRPSARPPAPVPAQLTAREKQVLELLVAARSNREIARSLGIEERTVKAHVAKLMRKVGVENRIALSIHAVTHEMISAPAEAAPGIRG